MTIRIFVGCAANHEDAESQAVLEWSVKKFTTLPYEITWMKLSKDPLSPFYSNPKAINREGWNTSRWATPFSGFRFAIPHLCGFKGKAIYMDSDVIPMADMAELWNQEFLPGKVLMSKGSPSWRMCVSMWNCKEAGDLLPSFSALQGRAESFSACLQVLKSRPQLVQTFQGNWNCLDGEGYENLDDLDIKVIHYTSMAHQPHLEYALLRLQARGIPHWFQGTVHQHWRPDLIRLFKNRLQEAGEKGYGPDRYEVDPIYGPYEKASTAGRSAGIPQWGKQWKQN